MYVCPECAHKWLENETSEIIDNYIHRKQDAINDLGTIFVSFDSIRIVASPKKISPNL